MAAGFATTLWYQSGFVGAPAFEANTAQFLPTDRYIIGWTRSSPGFAPVLCRSSTAAPSNLPPTFPS